MKCPICGVWVRVLETRARADNTTRRTMECANLHKFRTIETVELVKPPRKKRKEDDKSNDS